VSVLPSVIDIALIWPVMVAETVSIGILSLPAVVAELGLVP
jgi:hypothetical protein